MKKIKNKVIAIFLLIITLTGIIQPVVLGANQDISGTGNDQFIARQYATNYQTTDESTQDAEGIIARRMIPKSKNWSFNNADGILVFCAEHGVSFKTGQYYEGSYGKPSTETIRQAGRVAYCGWYQSRGKYGANGNIDSEAKKQYAFTQQMIWEALGQSSATFLDSDVQKEYVQFKNEVNNKLKKIQMRPSFNGTTINLKVGETTTLTDTNSVLSEYSDLNKTVNGITITHTHGENTMKIAVSNECTLTNYSIPYDTFKEWGFVKEETKDKDTTVYIQFGTGIQDQIYSLNYNDPVALTINLSIESLGGLVLKKQGENGESLNGAKFLITGPNDYNEEVTINGSVTLEGLEQGTYHIKEIQAPEGYVLDTKAYEVEVNAGQAVEKVISNKEPTGTFTLRPNTNDK